MKPEEALAEIILHAAGSSLRHYTTRSREEILEAAARAIQAIKEGRMPE